jgi:hypothetical protein
VKLKIRTFAERTTTHTHGVIEHTADGGNRLILSLKKDEEPVHNVKAVYDDDTCQRGPKPTRDDEDDEDDEG